MAAVLLANTYFLHFDPKQLKLMQPYPPLGTLYAAALLRENQFTVALHDTIFCKSAAEVIPRLQQEKPDYFVIYDDGFNYLTKMCLTNMREAAFSMIAMAKQFGCTVVISSSDSTDHFDDYLEKGADFVIKGEAEHTLLELLQKLSEKGDASEVKGIVFRKIDEVIHTAKREVLHDLDSLHIPAWDLADIPYYRKKWIEKNGYFSINLTTTRGCPFKCNWCAKPIYGNRYNSRSPENVVSEIKFLLEKYGPAHFWFCDDIFGLKPGWIKKFSELVQQEQLQFRFKIQCRVDLLLEENNIEWLAKAGCDTIWVGAESGSQKILDAMDKGTQVQEIYRSTSLLRKHGIKPAFFLQFGYVGETKDDIEATRKMLLDLMPDDIGISVSYPLPGTKFFERVKADLKSKANWSDSNDLAMMYHGTYSPRFYRQLHQYIHKLFRRQQGLQSVREFFGNPFRMSKAQLRRMLMLPYFIPMSWWNYYRLNYIVKE
jgi:anaerobic magnesium-protoporphyrin IX monomethyl ester cyclase